jgi:predicted membrane protein
MSEPAATPPGERRGPALSRLVLGALLLLAGAGWLADSLGTEIPWGTLLPIALILVGIVLLATARSERAGHGGLVALGIVLTVLLVASTTIDVPIGGGVGERREVLTRADQLDDRYRLAVGSLTIDLRALDSTVPARLVARVGVGELVVEVPEGVEVHLRARAGMGDVQALGDQRSGIGVDLERTFRDGEGTAITLDLSVGIGSVKVEG